MNSFRNTYRGKVVLITGHTGFKGSWLSMWLSQLGARVVGLSIGTPSTPCNFDVAQVGHFVEDHRADIRDLEAVRKIVLSANPDFVFHLAAQALVRASYEDPIQTLEVNAIGSANILQSLRELKKSVSAVMITSDKAYDNVEWPWGYRETDRLGGKDPYSASKGMAELAIQAFIHSFFNDPKAGKKVAITRAGNVIGGGDWAADRIVPDCIRAWASGQHVDVRNADATRPWQHVLEPLSGYLALGADLYRRSDLHSQAYNFGPSAQQNHTVKDLIDEMAKHWGKVRWNDVSKSTEHVHEAGLLRLNCDKALFDLKWLPTLQFEETVRMTIEWYRAYYSEGEMPMHAITQNQIREYTLLAADRGLPWAQS